MPRITSNQYRRAFVLEHVKFKALPLAEKLKVNTVSVCTFFALHFQVYNVVKF